MLFRAAWIKRNDPWPCSFKHQPRVISVLSYYLTSLVNLSFCRFDPASRSAQFSNCVYCCILFGEMALCLEWLLSLRWSFGSSLRQADSFAGIQRFLSNPSDNLLMLLTFVSCLCDICCSLLVASNFTFVIRTTTFNYFIAYCIGMKLYGIQLFALSREVLPVHWYHLLCL